MATDIIENDDITLDWTFKVSLATDLVHGMNFLHNSPLRYHGRLKSSNCLVDNRWTLKVAEFGLHSFFPPSQANHGSDDCRRCKSMRRDGGVFLLNVFWGLLWTAPEVLRNSVDTVPKMSELDLKRADVYSFSIVLFEILFRSYPYDTDLMTPTEIITRIKQGENPLLRPLVPIGGTGTGTGTGTGHKGPEDVPAIVLKLMQKGWSECPLDRPLFPSIKTRFAALTKGRRTGIVDNMLALLEKYANNLEDIVETRTRELVDERKKSDMLLYRMLPRVVAEKLKNGQTVPAELYEGVTVFFSDIVGFTSLASASSPFEIVDLLNDLYTNFDSILSQHDVYKVETIGDAYMVVSGVPERNENRHVSEIANVALDFLSSIGSFRVVHRPGMQLSLRIGIHTGPCAAGVVGQTMPRYCLFGNTVNVASRMESTGSALKIQVSEETKTKLDDIGGYMLAHRGTIDVKGKGAQDTYWLEGKKDYSKSLPRIDSNSTPLED
ncbi:atrial natriuretic peptide receptor 2-like [Littorina saxatilis]|uniref:atrial natriuretic peptide receptor 2-like n=1 Tax=Littorina saxatilis TaxID=31220 RepID=UPI0038B52296